MALCWIPSAPGGGGGAQRHTWHLECTFHQVAHYGFWTRACLKGTLALLQILERASLK